MNELTENKLVKVFAVIGFVLSLGLSGLLITAGVVGPSNATSTNEVEEEVVVGSAAEQDKFEVTSDAPAENTPMVVLPDVLGTSSADIKYDYTGISLPLHASDYYYGKYLNAKAGAGELNQIPALKPGDKISILGNRYLTLNWKKGYVRPESGYLFASGVCWSVSAFGGVMDKANAKFQEKYGIPLFVFNFKDRAPHAHYYKTYKPSNGGYGYSVYNASGGQDYTFQVNPAIASIEYLSDLRIKIVLSATSSHPTAYAGQSISAKIMTNKQYIGYTFNSVETSGPYWDGIKSTVQDISNKFGSRSMFTPLETKE